MTWSDQADFTGCTTRLEWVDHADRVFDEEFRLWLLEHDPHPITVEYHAEADVHTFRLGSYPPPPRFGVVAGNIVHQLRATLDNLVWQLVVANGETPRRGAGGNAFPIFDALNADQVFRDRARSALRGVHPDHVAFIEGLQPYQSPEWRSKRHPLSLLADLSNTDKHQVLRLLSAQRPTVAPIDLPVVFSCPSGRIVQSGHLAPDRRHPGAIIGWLHLAEPGFHPDVRMEAEPWSQLAFAPDLFVGPVFLRLYAVVLAIVELAIAHIERGDPLPSSAMLSPRQVEQIYEMTQRMRGLPIGSGHADL